MNKEGTPVSSATKDRFLTPEEAADFLQVSINTLSMWRSNQRYKLPYYKIGGSIVRYKLEDLISFAHSNSITCSAESEGE